MLLILSGKLHLRSLSFSVNGALDALNCYDYNSCYAQFEKGKSVRLNNDFLLKFISEYQILQRNDLCKLRSSMIINCIGSISKTFCRNIPPNVIPSSSLSWAA